MPFPVETKWITRTEEKLGDRFPASFVTEMARMNGGTIGAQSDAFALFPFLDATDQKRIRRTCNSIDRETATARKHWLGFPSAAVAIGANGGGDLLILLPMPNHPDTLQHAVY